MFSKTGRSEEKGTKRRKVLGLLELQHSDAFKLLSQRGVVPIYVFLLNV